MDASVEQTFDPQLPPTDSAMMESWLKAGLYKDWVCEAKPSVKKDGAPAIHAHGGANRVCSNDRLAAAQLASGDQFPKGVASVKELYDASGKIVGTAVSVKVADDSSSGKGWYWWEGAKSSGLGIPGCAGCHGAAASDPDHPGAGDYVYFRNQR